MRTETEILQLTEITESLMVETCIKTGLGNARCIELALYLLAEKLEFKDQYAMELKDAWRLNRSTMEITEDALAIAKMKVENGK